MNFDEIKARALEIRKLYAQLETQKYGQEWTTEKLMQGFNKDVSDLNSIASRNPIDRTKLEHELSDCLWSVLVLADRYDIDLGQAFIKTMNELELRIKSELS
jgi:NTP pyrophosphatase (non-canonical NTP hydrolase)